MTTITTEKFGNVLVAHTPDELTEETRSMFLDNFSDLEESTRPQVVLQMDRTEVCDSEGLEALLELRDELQSRSGDVRLSGIQDPLSTILLVTRLDQQFRIFDSIIEAVGSFESA